MQRNWRKYATTVALILLAFGEMMPGRPTANAATLADFGFGNLKAGGQPILGSIPLLVVTYELSTNGSTRRSLALDLTTKMDQLCFNFFTFPSLNGYYLENSAGAFFWQRAAVLGPVTLDMQETATLFAQHSDDNEDGIMEGPLDSRAGFQYLLGLIATKTGYDFVQWDRNSDGFLTQDELSILVIGNNSHEGGSSRAGANRPINRIGLDWAVPGQNVTVVGQVASLDHRASFMTIAHELSHSLGTLDLYRTNCFNTGLSLMTCTIFPPDDDRRTYHLDPWYKMRLGWLQPRIHALGDGGIATVAASQIISANTPVLLYDPAKGLAEYFIVEFRHNRVSAGVDHDLNVTDKGLKQPFTGAASGMAVWHVNGDTAYHEGAPTNQIGGSTLWNVATPLLRWSDGTSTGTRLVPISVTNQGQELIFEWLSSSSTWIDFAFDGPVEDGSFAYPFDTLAEGIAAASYGGTLKIKSGSTSTRITIKKHLKLEAVGGAVVIGR